MGAPMLVKRIAPSPSAQVVSTTPGLSGSGVVVNWPDVRSEFRMVSHLGSPAASAASASINRASTPLAMMIGVSPPFTVHRAGLYTASSPEVGTGPRTSGDSVRGSPLDRYGSPVPPSRSATVPMLSIACGVDAERLDVKFGVPVELAMVVEW